MHRPQSNNRNDCNHANETRPNVNRKIKTLAALRILCVSRKQVPDKATRITD
jgi:hypothetical protein